MKTIAQKQHWQLVQLKQTAGLDAKQENLQVVRTFITTTSVSLLSLSSLLAFNSLQTCIWDEKLPVLSYW